MNTETIKGKVVRRYLDVGYVTLSVPVRGTPKEVRVAFNDCCKHLREAKTDACNAVSVDTVLLRADSAVCNNCIELQEREADRERAMEKVRKLYATGVRFEIPGHVYPYFYGAQLPATARENPVIVAFEGSAIAAFQAGFEGQEVTKRAIEAAIHAAI